MYTSIMGTTTVRIDRETHARLVRMSELAGVSLGATIREAAEALSRQRFAHRVAAEVEELRRDRAAWSSYLAQAESTSVADGLD